MNMKSKQYAALPFRRNQNRLEVLLITTRNKGRWSVPKGWPIERTTPHGTAAIEAFEEAGLLGKIAPVEVGRFKHRKVRKKQEVKCEVRIFPLNVTNEESDWPEKGQRRRRWVSHNAAAQLVHKQGLRRAIENLGRDRNGR
jgi:8-oxo-dGTP pyrophosphatase MutT (NUDIX family)